MSTQDHSDTILKEIAKESLDMLFKQMPSNRIKTVLLTGSVANGEGTVIKQDTASITSDFDFIIYMNLPRFLENRMHLQVLSQKMTASLIQKGVNTHVNFTPSTNVLHAIFRLTNAAIYEYEFAHASKTLFGKSPLFDVTARPTKKDALELTFTVVNELVFLDIKKTSEIEDSYVYAKRSLTLLNSLLIFHGIHAKTYQERIKKAEKHAIIGTIPIEETELKMLQAFTEYKLSGSLKDLLAALNCKKTNDLIRIQRDFLQKFATKTLYHELTNFDNESPEHGSARRSGALSNYFRHCEEGLFNRFLGVTLYVLWTFSRDTKRKEIFSAYLFYRQSPKTILNTVVALLFLHREKNQTRKVLKEVFPWIKLNETAATEKLSSLWQSAEQSVKFN